MVFGFYLLATPVLLLASVARKCLAPTRAIRQILAALRPLARHSSGSLICVFLLSISACALFACRGPWHPPGTHDEYAYLFAADTFAHGRLTNPPPAHWVHFESIHLIVQPSYMAKYPPGQALFLALGWVVFGHPMMGVYLSFALATTAVCWMLQAWLPPRWALLGGVLSILLWAPTNWMNGYWGGAVAALGGTLVYGGLRRLIDQPRLMPSLAMGLGLAILANTRPYEGLVAAMPAIAALILFLVRQRWYASAHFWLAVVLPMFLVLTATACWMAWYNFRVTGDPLRLPYQVHDETYSAAPTFLWQSPRDELPSYRHESMRGYYVDYELVRFLKKSVLCGFNSSVLTKLLLFIKFFVPPMLLLPVGVLAWFNRSRWWHFAAFVVGLELLALTQTLYLFPHYAAPIAGLMIGLVVQGLRHFCTWRFKGARAGATFVCGAVLTLLVGLVIAWFQDPPANRQAEVRESIEAMEGNHLVFVRYGADRDLDDEWIYNRADLDSSQVIWARDLGPSQNQSLLNQFRSRQVWLLIVAKEEVFLTAYEKQNPQGCP